MSLAKIYAHTYQHCTKNKRKYRKPKTEVHQGLGYKDSPRPFGDVPAEVEVVNQDTIMAALSLTEEKLNPLVLNMASDRNPGGGVKKGARAQEEALFRRTNYCLHLNRELVSYPLSWDQVVYTPDVAVIKDTDHHLIQPPRYLSFVACAGLRNPKHDKDGKFTFPRDRYQLKCKILNIFETAILHGHDSLVLGALGCGAFHNSPREVVKFFNEIIEAYRIGAFKKIVFAVLGEPNFSIFSENIA